MVGDRMRATCADDISKMGLEVVSFTIKEVRDKNEYITNMGRPDIVRIKRDADVAAAEAERDTAIRRANALRESAVAKAAADQERVLAETLSLGKQAEAQRATVAMARSNAEQVSLRRVVGTNTCAIGVASEGAAGGFVIVTAALDNLLKGAAGQAVENLNLMLGLDRMAGLGHLARHA